MTDDLEPGPTQPNRPGTKLLIKCTQAPNKNSKSDLSIEIVLNNLARILRKQKLAALLRLLHENNHDVSPIRLFEPMNIN
jgi:hypothetical protein